MTQETLSSLIDRLGLTSASLDSGGAPVLQHDEQLVSQFEDISLIAGDSNDLGTGTLFTTDRRVIWASTSQLGVSTTFRQISMHAISRDAALHQRPCIYCQLDEPEDLAACTSADDEGSSRELKFVPADETQVEALFKAFCDGAENNPDEMEEDEGEFFYNQDEVFAGLDEAGMSRLQGLEDRLGLPSPAEFEALVAGDPERFEDDELDGAGKMPHAPPSQ